jgi:hypothetical protein
MSPQTLESELRRAAMQVDWTYVVHRCAWCKRVANGQGEYVSTRDLDPDVVVTDGMCPACAKREMALLDARRRATRQAAA